MNHVYSHKRFGHDMLTAMSRKSETFYCFSPPVMIATFTIEALLLVYTLVRYRMTPLGRVVGATLACLALFQFAEYHVCGPQMASENWSRVGYVAITLLPALGIHMIREIAGRGSRWLVGGAYVSSIAFALVFGLSQTAFEGYACAGNYAVFQLASPVGGMFFVYYYLWLFVGIIMALRFADNATRNVRLALQLQVVGYLSFMIPTGVVNAINPQTLAGLPSIMCGFAVLYALTLVFGIVPLVLKRRDSARRATAGNRS